PLDLGAERGADNAAEAGTFQAGGRARKAEPFRFAAALGQGERKGGVKDIARGKGVDGLDREGRLMSARLARAPERAVGPIGYGEKPAAKFARGDKRRGERVDAARFSQRLGGNDRMRCERKQRMVLLARLVDVEPDRAAARPRGRADR